MTMQQLRRIKFGFYAIPVVPHLLDSGIAFGLHLLPVYYWNLVSISHRPLIGLELTTSCSATAVAHTAPRDSDTVNINFTERRLMPCITK